MFYSCLINEEMYQFPRWEKGGGGGFEVIPLLIEIVVSLFRWWNEREKNKRFLNNCSLNFIANIKKRKERKRKETIILSLLLTFSFYFPGHPERIAVASTGRTKMGRKCAKRKRYPTSEPASKSGSFLTRSTGKSSNHGRKGGERGRIGWKSAAIKIDPIDPPLLGGGGGERRRSISRRDTIGRGCVRIRAT